MSQPRAVRPRAVPQVALLAVVGLATAALASSCFTSSEGLEPPLEKLYFPTGVAVSPGGSTLYVASSDFDLQYNGGSVAALNLDDVGGRPGIRSLARQIASAVGSYPPGQYDAAATCAGISSPNTNEILYPGACEPIDVAPFVQASATVGAFASSATIVARPDGPGARLFVPVRGDPSVTWFDIVDDRDPAAPVSPCGDTFCLDCAGEGEDLRCGPSHRAGELSYDNPRGVVLPVEPIGIAADPEGEALVVAHQSTGAASLLVNRWGSGAVRPTLQHVVAELPDGPSGVASVPVPRLVRASVGEDGTPTVAYAPAFLVSHSAAAEITLLRYEDDARSQPARPFLTRADGASIGVGANGIDSRGVAVDGGERQACESGCGDDLTCLELCLDIPLRIYVANRSPNSLLVGRITSEAAHQGDVTTGVSDRITIDDAVSLSFGASNVVLGQVVGRTGALEPRVFVVSFDSRLISVYDPRLRRIDGDIRTGRGPHGVVVDARIDPATGEPSSFLYIGHFTDSYLGVVSLDMRSAPGSSYGVMVLSLGPPVPPRESQ